MSSQYRPRRYLGLALIGASSFAVLAVLVASQSFVVDLDRRLSSAAFHFAAARPSLWNATIFVTDLGAGWPLYVVGTVAVFVLVARGELVRALVWATAMLGSRPIAPWFKAQFERTRPEFIDWGDYSFPSGHAFGSAVVYGMLALFLLRVGHGSRCRWVAAGLAWGFVGLVALSRVLLGVHYPCDVLAGLSLGLAWGFCWQALVDWWELRRVLVSQSQTVQGRADGQGETKAT